MKLQLVSPEHTEMGSPTNIARPPIGLEVLSSSIERRFEQKGLEIDIEIMDGALISKADIEKRIDADVVGFSCMFSNHRECLELAEYAKEKGARVVFGGPNTNFLAERILKNNKFVDWVVRGDGEDALSHLLMGDPLNDISNLAYRTKSSININNNVNIDVNQEPLFSLDHLILKEKYFENDEPIPICCIRGCEKACKKGRCIYCVSIGKDLRTLTPERVWAQVRLLNQRYGIKSFFEAGDSFLVEKANSKTGQIELYPKLLLDSKPPDLDVSFRIYERPDTINKERVALLKLLGVNKIFVGYEHYDSNLQETANRSAVGLDIWKALDALKDAGMETILALMFGLPGETLETAKINLNFIKKVVKNYENIKTFFLSVVHPLPGSALYSRIESDKELVREYNKHGYDLKKDDVFDHSLLTQLAISKFCNISLPDLNSILEEARAIAQPSQTVSNFGGAKLF